MSLYSCEIIKPEDILLKESKIFKNRILLTINYAANINQTLLNDNLYSGKKKYFFPLFERYLFNRISKETLSEIRSLKFMGYFIEEDERKMIKSSISEFKKREIKKYEEHKNDFEKKLSSAIDFMNKEIEEQKSFLYEGLSTEYNYEDSINYLHAAYSEILKKLFEIEQDIAKQDMEKLNAFYFNMLEGLKIESLKNNSPQEEKAPARKKKIIKQKDNEEFPQIQNGEELFEEPDKNEDIVEIKDDKNKDIVEITDDKNKDNTDSISGKNKGIEDLADDKSEIIKEKEPEIKSGEEKEIKTNDD